jgi:glycosyltransferase involved in cell wall biosynthesis
MRVLHIIKAVGVAGAEKHLLTLLPGLSARGVGVTLLVLAEETRPLNDYAAQCEALGIAVERHFMRRHLDPRLPMFLQAYIQERQTDIVHTHLFHADLYGIPAARAAGVRAVITSRHNDDPFRRRFPIKQIGYGLWRATSAGIAISDWIAQFCREVEGAPAEKVYTIHYGMDYNPQTFDRPKARAALRHELGIGADVPMVGMVCRLIEQKGVAYGLQAFANVHAAFPLAHLVIAGDGDLRAGLEAEARELGIAKDVHFLGWRADALAVLGALDVFLMPSLWEGFGLVLLEAMSCNVPVIASRVSAIPEIVVDGETGLLVPPRDVAALAAALRTLLNDVALRQHMGMMGEDRLEGHFTSARMVERTLDVYTRTLG